MAKRDEDLDDVAGTSANDLLAQVAFEAKEQRVEERAGPASQQRRILGGVAVILLIAVITLFSVPAGEELGFKWHPGLVGMRPPEGGVRGYLDGVRFDVDGDAELDAAAQTLTFFGTDGRRVVLQLSCGVNPECPRRLALSLTSTVGVGPPLPETPPIVHIYGDGNEPTRTLERNYTLVLKLKPDPSGGAAGGIYLCLQDADQGFLGGEFLARPLQIE